MNLKHKCFDVEVYEELEQKKLKGNVCFEKDIREKILKQRERLRELIWELAQDFGGSVLHYNDRIDDINLEIIGDWKND